MYSSSYHLLKRIWLFSCTAWPHVGVCATRIHQCLFFSLQVQCWRGRPDPNCIKIQSIVILYTIEHMWHNNRSLHFTKARSSWVLMLNVVMNIKMMYCTLWCIGNIHKLNESFPHLCCVFCLAHTPFSILTGMTNCFDQSKF